MKRTPRTTSIILQAIFLYAVWLLLSGHYGGLLLSFGLISVLGTLWCVYRMRLPLADQDDQGNHNAHSDPSTADQHTPLPVLDSIKYSGWLAREILMSNIDVARRVWLKQTPIDPIMLVVPDTDLDDLGKLIYANSITLTPGTVSLFVRDDGIHVHALTREGADALIEGEMLRRVQRLRGITT